MRLQKTVALPWLCIAMTLAGCETLSTREQTRNDNHNQTPVKRPTTHAQNQSTPVPQTNPVPPVATGPVSGQQSIPVTVPTPAPVVVPPQPTTAPQIPSPREQIKVGVILGPGGMKAYAHLGVLRELTRARVPIHAIVGLEWGAVIAGLYSTQGQINDTEWRAFKLRNNELPGEGFLSARIKAESVSAIQPFLDASFGSGSMDRARIEFACPAGNTKGDRAQMYTKGSYHDAILRCLPYPPMYNENNGLMASPFSVEDAAAWLRSRGVNVVLLVNVLGQGEIFSAKMVGEHPSENILWNEIRREMSRAKAPSVNHVINVNTSGHPITDYDGRRAMMDLGQKAASDVVNKMVSQYGF